jgi:succinate-acetate transporter protein
MAARLEQLTRISLRPIASPMPLGMVGLSAGTLVMAALNLGWVPDAQAHQVALVLIAFVFPLQATTSIVSIFARDGVAATAMATLSGTWLATGLVMLSAPAGSTSDALGVLLLVSGAAMLIPASGAWLSKLVPSLVFVGAALRFLTAGVYQLSDRDAWASGTGWIGIALGGLALYAAAASMLEGAKKRTVLPLGRRGRGRQAMEGGLVEQVIDLPHEAGVREQL